MSFLKVWILKLKHHFLDIACLSTVTMLVIVFFIVQRTTAISSIITDHSIVLSFVFIRHVNKLFTAVVAAEQ
jgi:hypothetical protein